MKHAGLDYLHDVDVENLNYLIKEDRCLEIQLARTPVDLGYAPWNGRRLKITLAGIALMRMHMLGHLAGGDGIDAWREDLSEEMASAVDELRRNGLMVPAVTCRVVFRSGSEIEIVCENISVAIDT